MAKQQNPVGVFLLLLVYLIAKYVFHISWYMDDTGQEKSSGQRVQLVTIPTLQRVSGQSRLLKVFFLIVGYIKNPTKPKRAKLRS